MKSNKFTQAGWLLILSGLILIGFLSLPQADKRQQVVVQLEQAIGWLDAAEKVSLEKGAALKSIASCEIDLDVKTPRTMRIGKMGQISLTALMICPSPINANGLLHLRTKLTEEQNRVVPVGEISQKLLPGQNSFGYWSVVSSTTGQIDGTLWVYLDIGNPNLKKATIPLASIPIGMKITSVFGLEQGALFQICYWLIVVGVMLLFIDWISTRIARKNSSIR